MINKDKNVEEQYWSNEYRVWLIQYYTFAFAWLQCTHLLGVLGV